jgi:hypothetical protein
MVCGLVFFLCCHNIHKFSYPVWLDMHRSKWSRNDFTDDTDQLLLILQSLERTRDGKLHPANFAKKLKEWSIIGFPELGTPPRGIGFTVGSTLTHPEFRFNPHKAAFDVSLVYRKKDDGRRRG